MRPDTRTATRKARLLVIAVFTVGAIALTASANAQGQILTLAPVCDDTSFGGPASGFLISATRTDITLRVTSEHGAFSGTVFTPVPGLGIGVTLPPGIGRTTFEVHEDPNRNGAIDPGERLLETIVAPDPCAPPFPTSKEQCNNGGYLQFGFKNQGQCVAFVQRGPKP